ncbi:UDP-N-acetylmuramoyl-L-alanine--D-glutamate ligase [Bartonella sp. DGB2]|uniref:UDP-N-acetylmuramoyl-L-alanine--D-glutamate ligase n=1 Tax=Bartonella sp. DGB2 TaxID=3388426 RepID=UPI0039903716
MIDLAHFTGQKMALFGLGTSGCASAQALLASGVDVIGFDDDAARCQAAKEANIPIADLRGEDWKKFHALVLTPGVPLTHPKPHWSVEQARQAGVDIIGDIELFVRARRAFLQKNNLTPYDLPLIAITGTNGKSTTTALLAYLLNQAGFDAQMGGNIGTPILSLAPFKKGLPYVVECSSFQIALAPSLNPTYGILLNITPDHIDRHGDFVTYAALKGRLVKHANHAFIGIDDVPSAALYQCLYEKGHQVTALTKNGPHPYALYSQGCRLFAPSQTTALADLGKNTALRGSHNAQNALAAVGVMSALGMRNSCLQTGLDHFSGLPHRLQQVGQRGDVIFINDSKATNAEAVAPALDTFNNIYWIAGGVAKEGGITTLRPYFSKIRKAYLIGEAAPLFARQIGRAFPFIQAHNLKSAVKAAANDAQKDPTGKKAVLFSPACASYDQYPNYSARGDAFITHINQFLRQS